MFRVKICGITRVDDARQAVRAGADALGLNFYPDSRRYVTPADAQSIAQVVPPHVAKVGVFVNATVDQITSVADVLQLDYIQLHGDEPPDRLLDLAGHRVIRAFRSEPGFVDHVVQYLDSCRRLGFPPAAVLIDGYKAGTYGGTGETARWDEARKLPNLLGEVYLILAGGLTPENVRGAVESVRPWAVDVAGGVESHPGIKDAQRMRCFIEAAHDALAAARDNGG